jgi:hypothetical protein
VLARTREELKSERVRDSLARWAEHFKPNIDEVLSFGWSGWTDSPDDQQVVIALVDQLLDTAKSAITRSARNDAIRRALNTGDEGGPDEAPLLDA